MSIQLQLFAPYRSRRAGRLQAEKVRAITNYELMTVGGVVSNTKPWGGIWTSSYTLDLPTASDWLRFCRDEHPDFIPAFGYLYRPTPGVKIYEISTLQDINKLQLNYRGSYQSGIDFEALARHYDAIHLSAIQSEVLGHPCMKYWDSECTLWFALSSLSYQGRIRLDRETVPPHPLET